MTDSKHTRGPDAWSALCVQMFWLSNLFVRLRPASFCGLSAAEWSEVGGCDLDYVVNPDTYSESRVTATHWTMDIFSTQHPICVLYSGQYNRNIDISNLKWESYLSMSVWGLNLAWMTVLQREWGRYLLMSSVRMEASLSSGRWSGLLWALSALQLRLGTKLEASAAM